MSKAKELARKIKEFPKACYVYAVHDDLGDLIDAVLSEPEPLRGWIEVNDSLGCRQLVNLESGACLEETIHEDDDVVSKKLYYKCHPNYTYIKESYDSIKQKIKEAG